MPTETLHTSSPSLAGPGGDAVAERPSQNLLRALLPASRADRDVFLAVALVRIRFSSLRGVFCQAFCRHSVA